MSKKRLFLLDGMALAYRAHFAFVNSNLRNTEGIATGPIMGFANTLEKMLEDNKPSHIAVAWDTHAPTFRHVMDKEYKAHRPPMPDELRQGIPLIKEMLEKWGVQNIEKDGYEADDIIGTIATQANAEDVDVFMVTPDKDFMQLVHDHIKMLKPDNKNGGFDIVDREGVMEYFGVYPEKVIDVLAIIGDAADNVPGVPGIGKKGAPQLVQKYGSLEGAIEAAPTMTAKRQREGLIEFKEQALFAKEMVTIMIDVPDTVKWESLEWPGAERKDLGLFFQRMGFKNLTRRYLGEENTPIATPAKPQSDQGDLFAAPLEPSEVVSPYASLDMGKCTYELIESIDRLKEVVFEVGKNSMFCFDTETDSPDPLSAGLVGISLSAKTGTAFYVAVNVEGGLEEKEVLEIVKPLFEDESTTKIAHNFKFDYLVLHKLGIEIKGGHFDTMVAAYLVDSSQKLKMDELAKKYLQYEPVPISVLIGEGKKQISMAELTAQQVYEYACEDADVTLQLHEKLNELMTEDDLSIIAETVDFPLIHVLGEMEEKGISLDVDMLSLFSEELLSDLQTLQTNIYEAAGEEFNINSTQQLGVILFEKLGLPSGKKTKTGRYSTSEDVLTKLAVKYELPKLLLDYRQITKLKSTYVDALPAIINTTSGRVHTEFNQTVAATGRLSSHSPNLQNIPIRTPRGREIRKAFIPEDGFKILSADYSQVELRVIATIAKDKAMIEAFMNNEDIHSRTAKEIFALDSLDEVTADHRRKAKEVNFGIPYGVSAYGLAANLGIENKEGKEMIESYFNRFPNILEYMNDTKEYAKEHGYVKTLLGRRRYIPEINSGHWPKRGAAERVAINMPIQGTAADIIKLAMIQIHEFLKNENLKSRMLLQVHDELVFEIHESEMEILPEKVKELMEGAYPMDVPLSVEMGIGENWLEAH